MGDVLPIGGGSLNFSTTEHVVGTWIDGKPLYQKTYSWPLGNATQDMHAIDGQETMCVFNMYGVVIKNDCTESYPLPRVHDNALSGQIGVQFYQNQGVNILYRGGNWTGYTVYVTLNYTKTTD